MQNPVEIDFCSVVDLAFCLQEKGPGIKPGYQESPPSPLPHPLWHQALFLDRVGVGSNSLKTQKLENPREKML